MKFSILTIFPDLIYNYCQDSILGRAQSKELISVEAHNFRDFSINKHHTVDDKPFGGGAGMVLQVEPIYRCLENIGLVKNGKKIKESKTKIIIMDPDGKKFDQTMAKQFSKLDNLVIISGRYEGFDERVYKFVDDRVSVGDYVLAGGELPAMIITEAVARLLPGVLGNFESLKEETFENDIVEYPQYTRPENFMGLKVPKILLSGDHKKIGDWRKDQSR
ncbi:MAG: tRNA (guanosine(37)-N1)-methyltransferase TrmD [Candidatus Magasanikbacteria bacterium]|nr:tRNA (guanosine(37)-N1)-methyltransferase TrmD [Candidatus Magasanikbacteria bacterium]